MYLKWDTKKIANFSDNNITSLYNKGFIFTRAGKGVMDKTRSLRVVLSKFELNSENRRILRKIEGLNLNIAALPYSGYSWKIGKLAKDFYDTKFGKGIFSANKIKEIMTNKEKSNFNTLFIYSANDIIGYSICYANKDIIHYSYPFYELQTAGPQFKNIGMGMMTMAISAAKQNNKKYVYLGSAQRESDIYKLQFKGLEWFDKDNGWDTDLHKLKSILKKHNTRIAS